MSVTYNGKVPNPNRGNKRGQIGQGRLSMALSKGLGGDPRAHKGASALASGLLVGDGLEYDKQGKLAVTKDTGVEVRTVVVAINGGGSAISTGVKGFVRIPFSGSIRKWTLLAEQTGSIVVDVWKDSYANHPPTVGDTITGSSKPTLSSADSNESSTLSGWDTYITAGEVLVFNVDSASTVTLATLELEIEVDE